MLCVAAPTVYAQDNMQKDTALSTAFTVADARISTAGKWEGELQYLDYQSNDWQGIPMQKHVEAIGDGVTIIERATFDDGPKVGNVYISSISILAKDGVTETGSSFRAGRTPVMGTVSLRLVAPEDGGAIDANHWTLLSETDGTDDERPARIRNIISMKGDVMTSLKEVDFTDDDNDVWLSRNRTILKPVSQ